MAADASRPLKEYPRLFAIIEGVGTGSARDLHCCATRGLLAEGSISFLHRFGSALNHHVHLHVCATDGVFMPAAGGAGCCAPPTFLLARPITQADLATLTERERRRVIRWFRLAHLFDASAVADMLVLENSRVSIDASVRIAL